MSAGEQLIRQQQSYLTWGYKLSHARLDPQVRPKEHGQDLQSTPWEDKWWSFAPIPEKWDKAKVYLLELKAQVEEGKRINFKWIKQI